jgi:hypothetical protein
MEEVCEEIADLQKKKADMISCIKGTTVRRKN